MKNKLVLLFLLISGSSIMAQEMAITASGDTIFVFNDGTWSYDRTPRDSEIVTPETLNFAKREVEIDSTSRVLLVNEATDKVIDKETDFFSIQYSSDIWNRVPPATINPAASYTFSDEQQNVFAMVIAENVELGTENIFKFALENAEKNTGANPRVQSSEWVRVNGTDLIKAEYNIEMSGLKFVFNSLFYSSEKGTIQFMTWTFENIYQEKKAILDQLLAGLVIK